MAKLLESKRQQFLSLGREQPIKGCEILSVDVAVPHCLDLPCVLFLYEV